MTKPYYWRFDARKYRCAALPSFVGASLLAPENCGDSLRRDLVALIRSPYSNCRCIKKQ